MIDILLKRDSLLDRELITANENIHAPSSLALHYIDRTIAAEAKIKLPQDIIDAIEICKTRAWMDPMSIIQNISYIEKLFRDYDAAVINALHKIRKYTYITVTNQQRLLEALVKGYEPI